MGNTADQKLKILYIMEMFQKESDEHHVLTATDIIEKLADYEIKAERKGIYRDIETLQSYGMDIVKSSNPAGYYLASRDFEIAELKLLVDAVSASKFVTDKKTKMLVDKLETLASDFEKGQLQRQVVVSGRVKAENEKIFYAIDEIYKCIDQDKKITFQYAKWNKEKKRELRHGGANYVVSPELLLWDNEYYYLIGYDEKSESIRTYRVDKMVGAKMLEEKRTGHKERAAIDKKAFHKRFFSMFSGEKNTVIFKCNESLVDVMLDRFGTDVSMRPDGDGVIIKAEVEVSSQFFGWLTGLGNGVKIQGPTEVVEAYKAHLESIINNY